jgi:hypothetical protein
LALPMGKCFINIFEDNLRHDRVNRMNDSAYCRLLLA